MCVSYSLYFFICLCLLTLFKIQKYFVSPLLTFSREEQAKISKIAVPQLEWISSDKVKVDPQSCQFYLIKDSPRFNWLLFKEFQGLCVFFDKQKNRARTRTIQVNRAIFQNFHWCNRLHQNSNRLHPSHFVPEFKFLNWRSGLHKYCNRLHEGKFGQNQQISNFEHLAPILSCENILYHPKIIPLPRFN